MTPELQDLETLRDMLAEIAKTGPFMGHIAVPAKKLAKVHAYAHRACELAYERLDIMAEVIQREQERQIQKEEEERLENERSPF